METQREFEFELPVGHVDQDGVLHRTAVLRKMTGREEAIMADKRNRNSAARMITELLGSCLVRLGTLVKPGPKCAQALYSADRHYLLLKLREITFGPEMQGTYSCPTCRASSVLIEDLSQMAVNRLEDGSIPEDIVVQLEDGYVDRDGNAYGTMVFRYPTGADEDKIASVARDNASQWKNALMARCLIALGDMPRPKLEVLGTSIFTDLTMKDRALIDRAMNDESLGIKLRREIVCSNCGREYSATLDFSNFLSAS